VAEGARLESVFTRKGNVGSNPTLSAIHSSLPGESPLPEIREIWAYVEIFRPQNGLQERGLLLARGHVPGFSRKGAWTVRFQSADISRMQRGPALTGNIDTTQKTTEVTRECYDNRGQDFQRQAVTGRRDF
jgi:hypothetical protein